MSSREFSSPGPNASVDEHVAYLSRILKLPSEYLTALTNLVHIDHDAA